MAINIGNEAVRCVQELKGNPDFVKLVECLDLIAQKRIYAAIRSPIDQRVQQTAHADGIDEVVDALRIVLESKLPSQIVKPAPRARREFVE